MNKRQLLGEIAACACMMIMLALLLVFGSAVIPYQPSPHNETTYAEATQ